MTAEEMRKFLGLTFITGIIKKPKHNVYWTDDPVFGTPTFPKQCPTTDLRPF
jgi:hypothetical protein